jgi:hypothetical protein
MKTSNIVSFYYVWVKESMSIWDLSLHEFVYKFVSKFVCIIMKV